MKALGKALKDKVHPNGSLKLIGVQSNHGVEYFGGPAAPTLRFSHNQQFLPQYKLQY